MTENITSNLYRYDLTETPEHWNSSYLNFEYEYDGKHKNQAMLYFFTNSLIIAKDLGEKAAIKNNLESYYLTQTEAKNLNLIDFNDSFNIYQMLCLLTDLNIDIFKKELKTFDNDQTFADLKKAFDCVETENDSIAKIKCLNQIKVHSNSNYEHIGLFGQRLTDFGNGEIFKKIVRDIYPTCDGYRWQEFEDNRGLSYCLFDSEKISEKTTENIRLNASS